MKLYDEDGLPIDGYDYRKHMVLSSCRRKQSAPWVNPNLFYQYNQKEIQEREEYSQAVSEHRSQLLNECRSNHQSEEKALQDFRWKTNGESELSFNQNDNGSCKSSNNGSKYNESKDNRSKNSNKNNRTTAKPSKQKQDLGDTMSFISFASDVKSTYSNNKHIMLEITNQDVDYTDKQVVNLIDNLNDEKDAIKEEEIDDFFNAIRGGDDAEVLKDTQSYFWENKENKMIQKDV